MAIDTSSVDSTVADSRAWDAAMLAANKAIAQSSSATQLGVAVQQQAVELAKTIGRHVEQGARSN